MVHYTLETELSDQVRKFLIPDLFGPAVDMTHGYARGEVEQKDLCGRGLVHRAIVEGFLPVRFDTGTVKIVIVIPVIFDVALCSTSMFGVVDPEVAGRFKDAIRPVEQMRSGPVGDRLYRVIGVGQCGNGPLLVALP